MVFTTTSAETIGLPKANNEYTAIQLSANYRAESMRLNFLYTWSRSVGNFEGAVKSDINQTDAGITQDFEHYEERRSEGSENEFYGAAYSFTDPRSVRLGIEARF
jgi:hypothetical protein